MDGQHKKETKKDQDEKMNQERRQGRKKEEDLGWLGFLPFTIRNRRKSDRKTDARTRRGESLLERERGRKFI